MGVATFCSPAFSTVNFEARTVSNSERGSLKVSKNVSRIPLSASTSAGFRFLYSLTRGFVYLLVKKGSGPSP